MNGKARPVRDVIVLVNLRYASGRRVLSGVFNYLADGHPWRVRILQSNDEFTASVAAQAETTGVDGMILTLPGQPGALEKAAASDIPAVFMNLDGEALRKRTNAAIITVDNAAIGQEGAATFCRAGSSRRLPSCTGSYSTPTGPASARRPFARHSRRAAAPMPNTRPAR